MVKKKKAKKGLKYKRELRTIYDYIERSYRVLLVIIVVFISAILAGGIYVMVTGAPFALTAAQGRGMIFVINSREIYYRIVHQTLTEAIGVTILLMLGTAGLYSMMYASEKASSQRIANTLFALGAIMFVISLFGILLLLVFGKSIKVI